MELYNTTDKSKYELNIPSGIGEYYSTCPACSHNRKPINQKKRCFSWNRTKEVGHCYHCGSSFVEFKESEKLNLSTPKYLNNSTTQQLNNSTPKPIYSINSTYLIQSLGLESNLGDFLKSNFTEEEINEIMEKYRLGMTKDRGVIYWYIDKENRIRSGKIMQYDSTTGKRLKTPSTHISWVHTIMKNQNLMPEDWNFTRCLFGEHLLKEYPKANVCLVESEKTAVIASVYMPNEIWVATGGKEMFNEAVCEVLKGRKVVIFPDLGATQQWREKAIEISKNIGCKMIISEKLEELANQEQKEQGLDIADYLLMINF